MYKFLLISLFFITSLIPASAQQKKQTIATSKQAVLNYIEALKKDTDLKNAVWSVMVTDCSTKKAEISYNASQNLVPASIMKLITTGVGALTFRANHQFTTTLAYDGVINADSVLNGNLYIIGGGDPTFGSTQFKNTGVDTIFAFFAESLRNLGVKSINGKLIADISLFDDKEIHDTWEWGDIGNYYGCGTSALSFCENAFSVAILPGDSVTYEAHTNNTAPFLWDYEVINRVTTSAKDQKVDALIYSSPMSNQYIISGTIPISKDSVVAKGAIQNPAMVCIRNFGEFMHQNGMKVSLQYEIKKDTATINYTGVVAEWKSPTYREIAENTNRYSNNMFAETILKNIAACSPKLRPASYTLATDAVVGKLKSKGVDTKMVRIMDGSGLSRQNLISAEFMCQYLLMMRTALPSFDKWMPAPGERGTVTNFMSDYKNNRKNVRLKSGSMTGVLNYAGYVKNKSGKTLCVTVMTNNFTCKVSKIRPKIEKLVYLISEM